MLPSLLLPFADIEPRFAGDPAFAGPRAAVPGRPTIGDEAKKLSRSARHVG